MLSDCPKWTLHGIVNTTLLRFVDADEPDATARIVL